MVKRQSTKTPMKTKSLLIATALAIVIAWGLSVRPAQAGYIVTLDQVGSNVVATGIGAIDLTGLTFFGNSGSNGPGFMVPNQGTIVTGTSASAAVYTGLSGPTSFGTGFGASASSASGDLVGNLENAYSQPDVLFVPQGYVSGHALLDSSTYNSATFSSLGVTPGIYEWTWGNGPNQNFTLAVGVPDSGSTFGLIFLALIALFGAARFRSSQLA